MGVRKKTKNQGDKPNFRATGSKQSGGARGLSQTEAGEIDPSARIWQVVAMIPRGRVASYGQVARLAGMPTHARYVGRTLSQLPKGSKLPWHRVVNSQLKISNPHNPALQRKRLAAEGIELIGVRVPRGHHWDAGQD